MTVVMLAVAALAATGMARKSLELALEASNAQEELQRTWAARSVRKLLLERAAETFLFMID